MSWAELDLYAVSNDRYVPAVIFSVVCRAGLELGVRPDNKVFDRSIMLEPVSELVARRDLGPVALVRLSQYTIFESTDGHVRVLCRRIVCRTKVG